MDSNCFASIDMYCTSCKHGVTCQYVSLPWINLLNLNLNLIWSKYVAHNHRHSEANLYNITVTMGLLPDAHNRGLRMRRERFPRHRGLAIPTCIMARASRTWSLTSGFLWSRWRGKRSRHSRRMHNPQFSVSDKRPIAPARGLALLGLWHMWAQWW